MRRLAPAVLLSLVPCLARAGDLTETVVPIAVVGTIFGFSALMVGIVSYSRHRNQRLRHETIRVALEKGQPLPPGLLDAGAAREPAFRDLRRGLVMLAVGLGAGLFLFFSRIPGTPERAWAVGFVPALMGIAYLISHLVAGRQAGGAPADRG
jgi:uncharacterized membrane protein HdeD (DUF308 family)